MLAQAPLRGGDLELASAILEHVEQAEHIATARFSPLQSLTSANVLSARQYLDAATINLLRLAPAQHIQSLLPNLSAESSLSLAPNDPRSKMLKELASRPHAESITPEEHVAIIAAVQGAQKVTHRDTMKLRSFRNVIIGVATVIATLAVTVALVGLFNPTLIPLCFVTAPEIAPPGALDTIACPTASGPLLGDPDFYSAGVDIAIVEFIGLLAAGIAAASALRNIRGSSDPYSLPVALALLKLPTGAMTAFLGLLLLRADLVPAVKSFITNSGQILALALILGYSQQVFTGLVDRQAQALQSRQQQNEPTNQALLG
jgi:hypothetical protein